MFDTQELVLIEAAVQAQADRKLHHPKTRETYRTIARKIKLHKLNLDA